MPEKHSVYKLFSIRSKLIKFSFSFKWEYFFQLKSPILAVTYSCSKYLMQIEPILEREKKKGQTINKPITSGVGACHPHTRKWTHSMSRGMSGKEIFLNQPIFFAIMRKGNNITIEFLIFLIKGNHHCYCQNRLFLRLFQCLQELPTFSPTILKHKGGSQIIPYMERWNKLQSSVNASKK